MLSKYFEIKTKSQDFKDNLSNVFEELKDKKVILYGAGAGFLELNKMYNFKEKFNIVGIADKKFEKSNITDFKGIKAIKPDAISEEEFDYILITNETTKSIIKFLQTKLGIEKNKIKRIFVEEIPDEAVNLNYLYKYNFDKTLPKLIKKLNNKKVVLYGAGSFLKLIKKHFDLSALNVIGITDRNFMCHVDDDTFLDYKICTVDEVKDLNPDYLLISTKRYIAIMEDLYYNIYKDVGFEIKPLLQKSFFAILKEIWK